MDLTSGDYVSARGEREGESSGRRNPGEKAYSKECANGARADWARSEAAARMEGWAGMGRTGLAGLDPRRRFKWKLIFKFQEFLEFGKTSINFTRRFRWNLEMRIFPKIF
jgi:hypothetical protein